MANTSAHWTVCASHAEHLKRCTMIFCDFLEHNVDIILLM